MTDMQEPVLVQGDTTLWWIALIAVILIALVVLFFWFKGRRLPGQHCFRASRWRFLIAPVQRVPMRDVILLNWIGFFAIFALPLRLGELARPALTKMRHGIPISVGLGTIGISRTRSRSHVALVFPSGRNQ